MRWLAIFILILILIVGIISKMVGLMFAIMTFGYYLAGLALTCTALFLLFFILKNKNK